MTKERKNMGTTAQIQIRQRLAEFFMGKLYPLVVALIVTVGHIMETEFYFNVINVALAVVALCVCDSIRPMFITVTTFIFQVSKTNAPAWPIFSDYYFTEWRLPIILCLGALALFGIVFFVLKNRLLCRIKLFGTRLLLPALVLSLAFLLNGVASQSWSVSAFGFGASQIIVYLVLFLLFYLGLSERDNAESLVDYVSYIALVISYMIIVQMIHLFVFGNVISASGSILKDNINLGWTISNPLASILLSLIPALFLGAMRKKCGWIYFVTAVLVFISAFMTLSRNSMLFGTILFVVCVVVLCVRSPKMRRGILISSVVSLAALFVFAVIMRDSIAVVFDQLIKAGFGSTGRFEIWAEAWEHFLDNMLFGAGFFNLEDSDLDSR